MAHHRGTLCALTRAVCSRWYVEKHQKLIETVNKRNRYLELSIGRGWMLGSSLAAPPIWSRRAERRLSKDEPRRETCFLLPSRFLSRIGWTLSGSQVRPAKIMRFKAGLPCSSADWPTHKLHHMLAGRSGLTCCWQVVRQEQIQHGLGDFIRGINGWISVINHAHRSCVWFVD